MQTPTDDEGDQHDASALSIRVLIVDDHEMVAQGLARIVDREEDLELVGVALSVADAVVQAGRYRPDVILMDFRLPDGDGATATSMILAQFPETKVVMLSGLGSEQILARAIESGCVGMISKVRPAEEVVLAVRLAHQGGSVVSSDDLVGLLHRLAKPPAGDADALTPRELEVLRLLARAKPVDAIAEELFMSVHTARNHISAILSKFGAHSRLEAVTIATRDGLISIDEIG